VPKNGSAFCIFTAQENVDFFLEVEIFVLHIFVLSEHSDWSDLNSNNQQKPTFRRAFRKLQYGQCLFINKKIFLTLIFLEYAQWKRIIRFDNSTEM
jgi:hypothetical protein